MNPNFQTAIVGGGCFWCTEAVFQEVEGVHNVISGYSGGTVPGKPTYREICSGLTGHAEVVKVTYDPSIISFEDLLVIFLTTHDPTTLNKQGADRGTQYRSIIFYQNNSEKVTAENVIKYLSNLFKEPIVTEISKLKEFFEAEKEHQDYYKNNTSHPYCSYVIEPKLHKLRELHANKLK